MKIIRYEEKYRDDLIFMVLEAKNALGRVPTLNPDMLDVDGFYFSKGDMFWLALDENDRVIGSVGCNLLPDGEAVLHRLYVKYNLKRQGIGSALLHTAATSVMQIINIKISQILFHVIRFILVISVLRIKLS